MHKTALLIEGDRPIREIFGKLARGSEADVRLLLAEDEAAALEALSKNPDINYLIPERRPLEKSQIIKQQYPKLMIVELSPEESKLKEMMTAETQHITDCLSALLSSLLLRLQALY